MTSQTAIVIAHRLSTVRRMDELVILEGGSIVERGTHDALLERGGIYAMLRAHQSGGFIGADDRAAVAATGVAAAAAATGAPEGRRRAEAPVPTA